jgi:GxxExxY protein
MDKQQKQRELMHAGLTYKIIGILYKVYNTMGPGFQEKYYQRALRKVFTGEGIPFAEQVKVNLDMEGINIGKYYMDFVIDQKVVLEIKSKSFFSHKDIRQVLAYLKASKIEVGILAAFSSEQMKIKRIIRGY